MATAQPAGGAYPFRRFPGPCQVQGKLLQLWKPRQPDAKPVGGDVVIELKDVFAAKLGGFMDSITPDLEECFKNGDGQLKAKAFHEDIAKGEWQVGKTYPMMLRSVPARNDKKPFLKVTVITNGGCGLGEGRGT